MFGKKKKEGDDTVDASDKKKAKAEEKAKKKAAKEAEKKAKKEAKAAKKEAKKAAKSAKKEAKLDAKEAKKKNKKDSESDKDTSDSTESDKEETGSAAPVKKKKNFFALKKLIIILVLLFAVALASGVVYMLYFTKSSDTTIRYEPIKLAHVSLPDEILEFSFNFFPDLYLSLVIYNKDIALLHQEINRIESVGTQYPDQKKIAEREKKTWESKKKSLAKSFEKIEKKIESLFVAYKVNTEAGMIRINEEKDDLSLSAREALEPVTDLIRRIKAEEKIPEGLVDGTIYKVKKRLQAFRK